MAFSAPLALSADLSFLGSIVSVVSIVLTVLAALVLLICGLIGWKRGLFRSLLRLGAIVLATLTSLLLTFALRGVLTNLLAPVISSLVGKALPDELLTASPTLSTLIAALPGALLTPVLFGVLFAVCNLIFFIAYLIVKHIKVFDKTLIPATIKEKVKVDSIVSAAVGLLGCLVLIVGFSIPMAGYLNLADNVMAQIATVDSLDEDMTATLKEVDDNIVSPLADNVVFATSGALGGNALFNAASAIKVNGGKIVWEKEISYLFDTYGTLKPLLDTDFDFSKFGEEQGAALRTFANDFDNSVLIPSVAAELLPAAATAWNNGESFLGIPNPTASVPALLQPMMQSTMSILESTTRETLKADLITVSEVIATISESGALTVLGGEASTVDLLNALSQPGMISGLIDTLYANERMQVLVADVANLGFNAVGEALNIPADNEAVYNNLVSELNSAINKTEGMASYEEKIEALSHDIENVFVKYGMETTASEAHLYAECIIGIGPDYTAAAEEAIPVYFETISSALNAAGVAAASVRSASALPGSVMTTLPDKQAAIQSIVSRYVEENGIENLPKSIDTTAQLAGNKELEHKVVTMQSLGVTPESIANMAKEDFSKQSQAIESVLVTLVEVVEVDENDNITVDIAKLNTEALSSSLRDLASTRTDSEGNTVQNLATATTNLIKSALQTNGIDAKAADNLVEHIVTEPVKEEGGKDTLSTALTMVNVIKNENSSKEDFQNAVTNLIDNLDGDTATILSDCVSPNLINRYTSKALEANRANALCASIRDLLQNFGECSDSLSEEQVEAESAYLQTIFDLSMSAKDAQGSTLFGEKGNSKLGMTATEFVSSIAKSKVISQTVLEQKNNLKIAIGNAMGEADKAALSEALSADTALSAEMKAALDTVFTLTPVAE